MKSASLQGPRRLRRKTRDPRPCAGLPTCPFWARDLHGIWVMSPLPPVAPTPPTAPGVPQVPGVSGPSPTAAVFKSMMAGGQPSAATPAPTTVSQAHLAAPVGKPLFALAMEILWRRTEKSARPAAAARAALFDMGQGRAAVGGGWPQAGRSKKETQARHTPPPGQRALKSVRRPY